MSSQEVHYAPATQARSAIADGPIQLGASGEGVLSLQIALNFCGQIVAVTGEFNDDTDAAVRAFEAEHGLDANGVVDEAFVAQMQAAIIKEHNRLVDEVGEGSVAAPVFFGVGDETAVVTDFKAIVRSGPPDFSSTSAVLPHGLEVFIDEEQGKNALVTPKEGGSSQWTRSGNLGNARNFPTTARVANPISLSGLSGTERSMAVIHNNYGRFLARQAQETGYPEAGLAAVIQVESGPLGGFNLDGSAVIRFENHIFKRQLGDDTLWAKHFRIDNASKVWLGHKVRFKEGGAWEDFHGNQVKEHAVLRLARSLNEAGALRSQSVGLVQIMGFNHLKLGYADVSKMWDALTESAEPQLEAFISFIKNTSSCHDGLLTEDYVKFAGGYNGSGQKQKYGELISKAATAYKKVVQAAGMTTVDADTGVSPRPVKPASASGGDLASMLRKIRFLSGSADGKFGPATGRSTRAFQTRHGLTADGLAGTGTLGLANGVSATRTLKEGLGGDDVKGWQAYLIATPLLGAESDAHSLRAATKALQTLAGITVDGIDGPNTRASAEKLLGA